MATSEKSILEGELEAEFKNMSTSEKAKPERLFRSPKRFNVAGGGAGDSMKAGGTKVANQGRSINKVAKPPSSNEADAVQLLLQIGVAGPEGIKIDQKKAGTTLANLPGKTLPFRNATAHRKQNSPPPHVKSGHQGQLAAPS